MSNQRYLGGDASLACSAETQKKDRRKRWKRWCVSSMKKAAGILCWKIDREKLDELARYLYQKETITGEEFMKILNEDGAPAAEI